MFAGQGFDSLHPAKRRMFLGKPQLFSAFFRPFNAENEEKLPIIAPVAFVPPNLSLFFRSLIGRLGEQRTSVNPCFRHRIQPFQNGRRGEPEKPSIAKDFENEGAERILRNLLRKTA